MRLCCDDFLNKGGGEVQLDKVGRRDRIGDALRDLRTLSP
jgi:hypothetical protein